MYPNRQWVDRKQSRAAKHVVHRDDLRRIPLADILIEGCCQLKGAPHGGNFGGIPAANGLIESSRPIEHLVHILEVDVSHALMFWSNSDAL